MISKETIERSQMDPLVAQAYLNARMAFEEFRSTEDPLAKNVLRPLVLATMVLAKQVRIASEARRTAQMLRNLKSPEVSKN